MQLAELLRRLTPEEREIVFERRMVSESVRDNPQALSAQLTSPPMIAAAYAEVNAAQARLLQWLAERPTLEATWLELREALGERLPTERLHEYLTDLRQLALLDFDQRERGGFVATYPAAVSPFPNERRKSIRQWLEPLTVDLLTRMCKAIGVVAPTNKKDDCIQAIIDHVTDPLLREQLIVSKLSPAATKLFSWMVERNGLVSAQAAAQRVNRAAFTTYGRYTWTPETIWEATKGPLDPLTELLRVGLVYASVAGPGGYHPPTAFSIPREILPYSTDSDFFAQTPMLPPPLHQALVTAESVPNVAHVMRDLGHLLGFIETGRCEWKQDGQPYKRSLVAFGKLIGNRDQNYVDLLWELLIGAGLAQALRPLPPDYAVRYEYRSAGDYRPKELFGQILMAWIERGTMMLSRGGYQSFFQDNIRIRLLLMLRTAPSDTWITRASIEEWLRFMWPLVFAPDTLGVGGAAPPMDWRSIGMLLLGQGTAADGAPAVMMPDAHQRLLEPTDDSTSALPPWANEWVVQPDRTIVAPPNLHLDGLVDLWRVAALESNQGASVFRVSPDTVGAALNRGMAPDQIRTVLAARSRTPLPPTVERLIDDQSQRYGRIKVGQAHTFVQVDDPALLDELRRNAKLKNLRWHDVAPGVAFVQGSQPDAVIDSMRKAGYLPVRAEQKTPGKGKQAGGNAPSAVEIRRAVQSAVQDGMMLDVTWTVRGRTQHEVLDPLDLHGTVLHAYRSDGIQEIELPFNQITSIEVVEDPGDEDDDLDLSIFGEKF